jgi:hypothetical protein
MMAGADIDKATRIPYDPAVSLHSFQRQYERSTR